MFFEFVFFLRQTLCCPYSYTICRDDVLQKAELAAENCATGDLEHVCSVQINDVFMFMGRELEALDEIPAGNILGMCKSC